MQRRFILFQPVSPGTNWGSGLVCLTRSVEHTNWRNYSKEKIGTLVGFLAANNKVLIASGLIAGVKMVASERNSPQIYRIKYRTAGRWMAYLSLLAFDRDHGSV